MVDQPIVRLDFETRSTVDLRETGAYPYFDDPTTDVMCVAYAFDDEEPVLWYPWDTVDDRLADHVKEGLPMIAWNAQFERLCWRSIMSKRYSWPEAKLEQFHCSMAAAAMRGMPLKLEQSAIALGLEETKDIEGYRLMMKMTKPRRIEGKKIVWWESLEDMRRLGEYCKQDVRTERAISKILGWQLPEGERKVWLFDQQINDRGIGLDRKACEGAVVVADKALDAVDAELDTITGGGVSITSASALTNWLQSQGLDVSSVAKPAVRAMLGRPQMANVRRVLELRQEAAKSSVAKYRKMLDYCTTDHRMHGLLQYHGAHTGRWAGRGVQPQNFPRGNVKDPEGFIPFIQAGDYESIALLESPMDVLSSALRCSMMALGDYTLYTADFAAIEARVVAWLAGQESMLELFRNGGDPYIDIGESIFGYEVKKGSMERFVGKTAVLGLGFQMGWKRFKESCLAQGGVDISEELARTSVSIYREKNDHIKALWAVLEAAVMKAMKSPRSEVPLAMCDVTFRYEGLWLECRLPSGRSLWYYDPLITQVPLPWSGDEGEALHRDQVQPIGLNSVTRQFERYGLYGGLLAENITQAVARDILVASMFRVQEAGFNVLLTVHDEVVTERLERGKLEQFLSLMAQPPDWAKTCPVGVEGWEGKRYRK